MSISIIIPAKNEAQSLPGLLEDLKAARPDDEIIVVNDGSADDTAQVCQKFGVKEVRHPYSKGNGAAIKSGVRAASGDILIFMDGDGQHRPSDIEALLSKIDEGYDL